MLNKVLLTILIGLALGRPQALAGDHPDPDLVERCPTLRRHIPSFEGRLASKHDFVRYRLMGEVGELLPLDEAVKLLRRMSRMDPDQATRQQALVRLVSRGYRIDRSELPRKVSWPGWPLIDRQDDDQIRQVLSKLRGEGLYPLDSDAITPTTIKARDPKAGAAAQLLGLLGDRSDLARLRPLLDSENIHIRFSAANALINLRDTRSGLQGLNRVARAAPEPSSHGYVKDALLALHRLGDEAAIDRYLAYLAALEADDEHHDRLHYTQGLEDLSRLFGTWQDDAGSWRAWWEKHRRAG